MSVIGGARAAGMVWIVACAAALAAVAPATAARAQARGGSAGDPERDPGLVLMAMEDAYRSGPIAERIEVRAWSAGEDENGRPTLTSTITLRMDATARTGLRSAAPDPGDRRVSWLEPEPASSGVLALEMGLVRVWAMGERAWMTSSDDSRRAWCADLVGPPSLEALAHVLPGLPLVQLDLAFGHRAAGATLRPGLGEVRWSGVVRRGEDLLVLEGEARAGKARLEVDPRRWRVVSAKFPAADEGGGWVEIRCTPMDGPRPLRRAIAWSSDLEGRVLVGDAWLIGADARGLREGDRIARLPLLVEGGGAWAWQAAPEALGAHAAAEPDRCALVMGSGEAERDGEAQRVASALERSGHRAWVVISAGAGARQPIDSVQACALRMPAGVEVAALFVRERGLEPEPAPERSPELLGVVLERTGRWMVVRRVISAGKVDEFEAALSRALRSTEPGDAVPPVGPEGR